jgi:hypothetical protein
MTHEAMRALFDVTFKTAIDKVMKDTGAASLVNYTVPMPDTKMTGSIMLTASNTDGLAQIDEYADYRALKDTATDIEVMNTITEMAWMVAFLYAGEVLRVALKGGRPRVYAGENVFVTDPVANDNLHFSVSDSSWTHPDEFYVGWRMKFAGAKVR